MRDVMYILGGASVLLSAAYLSDTACNTNFLCEGLDLSGFGLFLGIGLSYVVGYVVQELVHMTPIVTVHAWCPPGNVGKCLYKWYTKKEWKEYKKNDDFDEFEFAIHPYTKSKEDLPERGFAFLQRYITLKHVGITIGSNLFVAGWLLLIQSGISGWDGHNISLAITTVVLSLMLLIFGRIKGLEQYRYMAILYGLELSDG